MGEPVPLSQDCAAQLLAKAAEEHRKTRAPGTKLSSGAMDMLGHFARDDMGELTGPRDLTYDYVADRALMSIASARRGLKALEDTGLAKLVWTGKD